MKNISSIFCKRGKDVIAKRDKTITKSEKWIEARNIQWVYGFKPIELITFSSTS
jgi:hypothetical protein